MVRKCRKMGGGWEQEERCLGDMEMGPGKRQLESHRAGGASCWAGGHHGPRAVNKGWQSQWQRPRNSSVMGSALKEKKGV